MAEDMTPEEVTAAIRAGRPGRLVMVDRAVVQSYLGRDEDRVFLKAHRSALLRKNAVGSLKRIFEDYQSEARLMRYKEIGLKVGGEMVKDSISDLMMPTKTLPAYLVGKVGAAAAKVGLDVVIEDTVASWREKDERLVGAKLREYFDTHGDFSGIYGEKDRERVARELGLAELYELSAELPGLSPGALDDVMKPAMDRIASAIETTTLDSLMRDRIASDELKRQAEENTRQWAALRTFRKETTDKFDEVSAELDELRNELDQTTQLAERNTEHIETLALLVGQTLPPSGRLKLLEDGLVAPPEGVSKEDAVRALRAQVKVEERIEKISKYLGEGQALVDTLRNFGVNEKIVKPMQDVVRVGGAVFSAYLSFQTGNYFAAVSSVSSLFGGGSSGPDPRIMEMLNKILGKLQEMDKKLDKILENQERILQKLDAISDTLEAGIQTLRNDGALNRQLIILGDLNRLRWFQSLTRVDGQTIADFRRNIFPSFEDLRVLWPTLREELLRWELFDNFLLGNDWLVSKLFFLTTHADVQEAAPPDSGAAKGLIAAYGAAVACLGNLAEFRGVSVSRALGYMVVPTHRIRHLLQKHEELSHASGDGGRWTGLPNTIELPDRVDNLLHVGFLGDVVEVLLNAHCMFCFRAIEGTNGKAPDARTALTSEVPRAARDRVTNWLDGAAFLIDIAIIQQSLLAGDILLPWVYDLFDGTLSEPRAADVEDLKKLGRGDEADRLAKRQGLQTEVLNLLAREDMSLLRQNIGLYFVQRRLAIRFPDSMGVVHRSYGEAIADPESRLRRLHDYMGTTGPGLEPSSRLYWNLTREGGGVLWIVGQAKIPLPPAERVADPSATQCYHSAPMHYLLELRDQVSAHRESYSFFDRLAKIDPELYPAFVFDVGS